MLRLKTQDTNDDDEKSFETNNNNTDGHDNVSPAISKNIQRSPSSKVSPRDVRQIDSSFAFVNLEDSNESIEDNVEQKLFSIASFDVTTYDEFKDEDENSEYTETQFVHGADKQQPFAQFIPGVNASLSLDQSADEQMHSMYRQVLPETTMSAVGVVVDFKDDVEAPVCTSLSENAIPVSTSSCRHLMEHAYVPSSTDSSTDNDDFSDGDSDKAPHAIRKKCFLATSLLLLLLGVSMIIGFTFARSRKSNGDAGGTGKCTLCANGTIPANQSHGSLITDSQTCSDFVKNQATLDAADIQCQQGQALAWLYCGCPTLPLDTSTNQEGFSCSVCPDDIMPIGEGCEEFHTAVHLAGGSPFLSCEQAIAAVPNTCACPNLDPFEQFRRLLQPLSGKALEDSTSPQFQALEWIVKVDPAKLSVGQDSTFEIQQRYVAAVLYFALGGETWTEQYKFLSANSVCLWNVNNAGLQCQDGNEISSIQMPNNGLFGKLPPEIRILSSLYTLELQSNSIAGSIPKAVAALESLGGIDLSNNALIGPLPTSLFALPRLRNVDLSRNALSGELHASIGDSTSLETVMLRDNGLSGPIPSRIGESTVLQSLDLDSNSLTGSVPEFLPASPMKQLFVGNNSIVGAIPASIGSLRQLQVLSLPNNELEGSLPDFSKNYGSLTVVELSQNRLSGNLERLFTTTPSSRLTHLQLEGNLLTGTISPSIGLFTRLVELRLDQNKLSGTIPTEIGQLVYMKTVLSLSNNRFSGKIPSSLGRLTNLETALRLSTNQLSSTIPTELGQLVLLKELSVGENSLIGTIPLQLRNLRNLLYLRIPRNKYIIGNIGILLSILPQTLNVLDLDSNMLSGTIPPYVAGLQALEEFHFFSNNLNGTLPSEIGQLTNLQSLQLTQNSLTGTIPTTIGDCSALQFLSLGSNALIGTIPTELEKLTALERLFVVGNALTGSVDFLCSREQFDMLVANTCDVTIAMPCSCCTHCCNPTGTNCTDL